MGIFTDVINTMRQGAAERAASRALAEVVKAVNLTGKKGTITLKLTISKLKGGDTETEVKAEVAFKAPQEDIPMGIFYPDEKGELHRTDPRQLTMLNEGNDRTINLSARRMGASGDDI
jgi:hypothetical protein